MNVLLMMIMAITNVLINTHISSYQISIHTPIQNTKCKLETYFKIANIHLP